MHLSIFGLHFAILISNVTLKQGQGLLILSAICQVHILDSCKLGQNQLTKSVDNVHLSMFCPKFSRFYSNVTLKIRSKSRKFYRFIVMSRY